MAQAHPTPRLALTEEAITILFCLVDDAYRRINPRGGRYEQLKSLSDSEVLTLTLFQQLRGVGSERSSQREVERFFAHLFPGVVGLWPSSLNRRSRKLRRFLEPLRRLVVPELVGDPETLIVDSTLLSVLHPRQVKQSTGFEGAAWAPWGNFSVYGVKLHLLRATNRVPVCYELTPANVAEVLLVRELLAEAGPLDNGAARRVLGISPTAAASYGRSWPGAASCLRPSRPTGGPPSGSTSRSALLASSASWVSAVHSPRPWWGSSGGLPPRCAPTPTPSTSTG